MRYTVRCGGGKARWFPYSRSGRKLALRAARRGACVVEGPEGEVLFTCQGGRCRRTASRRRGATS